MVRGGNWIVGNAAVQNNQAATSQQSQCAAF